MKIEDQEIFLMEQAEAAQKEVVRATLEANAAKKMVDDQITQLNQREENLKKELADLQRGRAELAAAVDEAVCQRYERLFKSKGENVVVGVHHGVCGGCHMKLPAQILVMCQAHSEIVSCTNCGRILYYTRDMALAGAE
jgi:predicted  nucleic acid-binding Zn-ribbon protein